MSDLSFVLYRSEALMPVASKEEAALIAQARERNRVEGISGLLYRESDYFFQWFEGPTQACADLLARLRADPRHAGVTVLAEGPLDRRHFANWQMGLVHRGEESLFDYIADHGLPGRNGEATAIRDFMLGLARSATSR